MTPTQKIQQFAQDVYLTRYNREIDDIEDEDGIAEVAKTVRWLNLFLPELDKEADWNFMRNYAAEIGSAAADTHIYPLPEGARKLAVDDNRPLVIMQGDVVVSRWEVVDPNQITTRKTVNDQRVTVVRKKLIFSRPFKDYEVGGTIIADTIEPLPKLSEEDVEVLDIEEVYHLLVLGTAKNATLPDIRQGGLTPSFVQKYGDELEKAQAENAESSASDEAVYDDLGYIGGV
jgi:hypothetical protein